MTRPNVTSRLATVVSASAIILALVDPLPVLADGITLTRNCQDSADSTCAVQVAPSIASAVAVVGPSTEIGPAIELNLAVNQVADAGTAVHLSQRGGAPPGDGGSTPSAGAASNAFAVSLGQTGAATATSGNASASGGGAQGGGSSAVQNPPSGGSDPGAGGGGQSPPSGGSTSGVNMITTVASIVQVVQVVARNNSNTTIAPIQLAEQCQQAAVSCSGNSAAGHP